MVCISISTNPNLTFILYLAYKYEGLVHTMSVRTCTVLTGHIENHFINVLLDAGN